MYVCIYVYMMYVLCMYVCECMYVCMYVRMYICMYVCMWISTCIALPYYTIGIPTPMFVSMRSELYPVTERSIDRRKFTFVFGLAKQTFELRR